MAPALSGPTRKRPPSKCSIEPPPAAIVWIAMIGTRSWTPATSVSKARSHFPAYSDTSVDVPPMSNPITRLKPAAAAVRAAPTTPAAGPDRIASLP